jgi:acetolactate synthase regulatory subunit
MLTKHTFRSASELRPEFATIHLLALEADNEPLLLPRVLQKFAVPAITVLTVHCETNEINRTTNIEVRFRATPGRAQLTSMKMEKIISIRKVALLP